ncbi:hypothetical protein ABEB36_006198 [Hypothenemus hampei]|uniref:Uncharacterized protein n=1 Tax=Hypothenemus hampei TaxID=57062 RepID=A0ABD1EPQ2_HYPHA
MNPSNGERKITDYEENENVYEKDSRLGSKTRVDEECINEEEVELSEKPFSYIDCLDAPRQLPEPADITLEHLRSIVEEFGVIKLCWPELIDVNFMGRTQFPDKYLTNSNKEKLLLLYTENFRRQFCFKYPDRKQLMLVCANECGTQKMVSTTLRPTTLPYSQIQSWQECAGFVAAYIKYNPLEQPTSLDISKVSCGTAV